MSAEIATTLDNLAASLGKQHQQFRSDFNNAKNLQDYYFSHFYGVKPMTKMTQPWLETYKAFNVTTKEEYEKLVRSHFKDPKVQEAWDSVNEAESVWDSFLQDEVDPALNSELNNFDPSMLDLGSITLLNVNEDRAITLQELVNSSKYTYLLLLRFFG